MRNKLTKAIIEAYAPEHVKEQLAAIERDQRALAELRYQVSGAMTSLLATVTPKEAPALSDAPVHA